MASIAYLNAAILLGAALVLAGVLSSLISTRIGAPLLLIFLAIGMLAGEDGPGGVQFSDFGLSYLVGSVALAIILFDGGLRTQLSALKGALMPALLLATLGTVITASLVGVIALVTLDLSPTEGFLLGAIVASTDAAAVLFLLRTGGLHLPPRLIAILEIESGTNDPVAVILTLATVALLQEGGEPSWRLLALLAEQGGIGLAFGLAAGWLASVVLNRVDLPQGLHPLFAATSAVLTFATAAELGGSGFLAVYIAGLVLGNRPLRAYSSIISFHDALTWLCQIVMFVLLGLLVTPHQLLEHAWGALAVAGGLVFLARPVATLCCLGPFRFPARETAFVAWVGLRGAVSIFLASIPVLVQLPGAQLYFNIAFFVVLISLVLQGWTVGQAARLLGLALPPVEHPASRVELDLPGQLEYELVGFPLTSESPILRYGTWPSWARPVLVIRGEHVFSPAEAGPYQAGDHAYFLAPPWRAPVMDRLFAAPADAHRPPVEPFGDFTLRGEVTLGQLTELYGLGVLPGDTETSIAEHFARAFERTPIVGDRVEIGGVDLIARSVVDDRVVLAGLDLAPEADDRRGIAGWLSRLGRRFAGGGSGSRRRP